MAQRQLTSLVQRARSCSVRPPFYSHSRSSIAEYPCFCKVEKEFFSAAAKPTHRQTGGRVTESSQKGTGFQKQNTEKSAPPAAPNLSQNHTESNTSRGKLSSSLYLMVGACFAVVGVLTLSPWVFPKSFYVEEKKEEDPHVLSEDADQRESKDDSVTGSVAKEEKGSLYELNHRSVAKREDALNEMSEVREKDAQGIEARFAANIESLSASDVPTKTESISIESTSPSDNHHGDESAQKILEAQLKDDVSQLIGHVPAEEFLPRNFSDGLNSNQSSSTFGKDDNASNTMFPFTNKKSEGFTEDLIDNEELNSSETALMGTMRRPSLFEAYYLANRDERSTSRKEEEPAPHNKDDVNFQRQKDQEKPSGSKKEVLVSETYAETVHNVFDLLEVVHAAEQRQAELDAQVYAEMQKRLKQAFQQELKDTQAKELMYAEEANRLAKEIELEKQRAVTVLELEQEKSKESLHRELKHKEEETQVKLKKAEILWKTQLAAVVAEEKLAYLKDVKDVKQELEALYAAFFTQSEEVRQSHTIHKLAVGTFALEDAMKRGVQVRKEVALIRSSYGDTGSDPLLDAVISSIPEGVLKKGTMTPSQLQQKFEIMKGEILELSLLPATGGGLLSHTAAKVVSILKVKEVGQYTDGVDAVVSQVQRLLTDEKLADAADLLEKAVQGTKAEVLAAEWIKSARDRAVLEQTLLLLQAHATAVASSLA